MSSNEFEMYTEKVVQHLTKDSEINFKIDRDINLNAYDGTYQIDIYMEYEVVGVTYKTLIECKKYKRRVERKDIAILNEKLKSTGSHKGILFSTSGFQSGALKYAKVHGIALVQIIDGKLLYETRSANQTEIKDPDFIDLPRFCGKHLMFTGDSLQVSTFDNECKESLVDYLFKE